VISSHAWALCADNGEEQTYAEDGSRDRRGRMQN
jgi:hypothetical protein